MKKMYGKRTNAFVWTFAAIAICIILLVGVVVVVGGNVAMGQQQMQQSQALNQTAQSSAS
jgi:hypothetical protein